MTGPASTFLISGILEPATLAGLTLKGGASSRPRRFCVLDCHDQAILSGDRLLFEVDDELALLHGSGHVETQPGQGRGKGRSELAPGPVRDALRKFPKLRVLMPIAEGDVSDQSYVALDDLEKTQVRLSVCVFSSPQGQASRVTVQGLRGYDKAFRAICAALRPRSTDVQAVFRALAPDVVPYEAKPSIALTKDEPSIDVANNIIRTFLDVARRNEAGVIADIDTEFLHDYRVSLRRIRSVLSLFKDVFSDGDTARLKQGFSTLMEPTGSLRDLDVYLLEKDITYSILSGYLHVGADAMFAQFETERRLAHRGMVRWLKSDAYQHQISTLRDMFDRADSPEPGPNAQRAAYDYACALIWKRYRKTCKLARQIMPETPDQIVHDLRIDCKKLRYLMEFFAPLFDPRAFKTIHKPLKKLQDNLGRFNDCSVQQTSLLTYVSAHSDRTGRIDAQVALTVGALLSVLDQRQRDERAQVLANFQHFDSPDIRHLFRSLFHQKEV